MREKVTLLVAVLVGLLAFGVACSPALSDQPVEDGSTSDGYERICEWRGMVDGNHTGTSYVLVDGSKVLEW